MPTSSHREPAAQVTVPVVLHSARDVLTPAVRAGAAPVIAVVGDAAPIVDSVDALVDPAGAARRARALAIVRRADLIVAPNAAVAERLASALPIGPWDMVVDGSLAAAEERLAVRPRRAWRDRRLAFVTPLPPEPTGVAGYGARLAVALGRRCAVTCFVAGPDGRSIASERRPAGTSIAPASELIVRADHGEFDEVLYALGNQPLHGTQLALLRRLPGAVELHDVRLVGAYAGVHAPGPSLADELARLYPGRFATALLRDAELDVEQAAAAGVWMVQEVARLATTVLVHSAHATALVAADAGVDAADVGPHAVAAWPPRAVPDDADEPLVVSMGAVHSSKRPDLLVRGLAELAKLRPDAWLALVGPVTTACRDELRDIARRVGVDDRVVLTGRVDRTEYERWIDRAAVAVQLRAYSNGESSGAVADCLGRGVPTVVTGEGAQAELGLDVAVAVDPAVGPSELARVLQALLSDAPLRRRLHAGALRYAAANTFDVAAERLLTALFGPDPA